MSIVRRSHTRPALVIDGNARTDLGVVRSLGRAGIPVYLLASDPGSITATSRYVIRRIAFPPVSAPIEERTARLRDIAAMCPERPVLFLTGDRAVHALSGARHAWEDLIDHDLPPHDVVATCADKARFATRCAALGLPVPETWLPASAAEVAERADALCYPVFVKPLSRDDWARLPVNVVRQVKGQQVDSPDALTALWQRLEAHGGERAVVQTMVVGPDEGHVTALMYRGPDGGVLGAFVGVKVRIAPIHAGLGVFVRSQPMPEIQRISAETLRELGYTGFADIDFKRDERTGAYTLLEMNCRYSTWVGLATDAGCNMPALGYAVMTGGTIPRMAQRAGPVWIDWQRDRAVWPAYRREGGWPLWRYLQSLAEVRSSAFFSWRDPAPFVRQLVSHRAQ